MTRLLLVVMLGACGGGATPITNGAACTEIGAAYCNRGQSCGALTVSVQECNSRFVAACCGGPPNACQQSAGNVTQVQLDTCAVDLGTYNCQALVNGTLPVSCIAPHSKPEIDEDAQP